MGLPEEPPDIAVEPVLQVAPVLDRPYLPADPVYVSQKEVLLIGQPELDLREAREVLGQVRTTFLSAPFP